MLRWYEIDLYMVIDQSLESEPTRLYAEPITNLLGNDDLAFCAYYVSQSMTSELMYDKWHLKHT